MNCHPLNWLSVLPRNFHPDWADSNPEHLPEDTVRSIHDFEQFGSHIIVLTEEIVTSAQSIALDDLMIEDISFPVDAFYLHFGSSLGLCAPHSAVRLEGAYVTAQRRTGPRACDSLIQVTLAPEHHADQDESRLNYTYVFDYHVNARGIYEDGLRTSVQEQLDRRFQNTWTEMGRFNFERRLNRGSMGKRTSFEELEARWKPNPEDVRWKAVSERAFQVVFGAALELRALGVRYTSARIHRPWGLQEQR
jgi:hypothetical protein